MTRNSTRRQPRRTRLNREQWLAEALEMLSGEGGARITIRHLTENLGVTTGSFYWHFTDREDFVRSLIQYWIDEYTETAIQQTLRASDDPGEQLFALMRIITEADLSRYDVAVRAWAAQESAVAETVRIADQRRLNLVRGLFRAMGFKNPELEMRVRTFVVFHSLELAIYTKQSQKARMDAIKRRHAWFTRP